MDYKLNYLKYKKKYINLKKLQSGGYYAKFERCNDITDKKQDLKPINIFEGSKYKDGIIILGKMFESFPEDKSIFYCHAKTQIIIISLSNLDITSKNLYRFFKKYNNIIVRIFSFEKRGDEQYKFVEYELNDDEDRRLVVINSFLSLPTSIIIHGGENIWHYNSHYEEGHKNKIVIKIDDFFNIMIPLSYVIIYLFKNLDLINCFNNTELPINFFFNIGQFGFINDFGSYFLNDDLLKENFVKLYDANSKGDLNKELIKFYVLRKKKFTVQTDTLEEDNLKDILGFKKDAGAIDKFYLKKYNRNVVLLSSNKFYKKDEFLEEYQTTFKYFLERELINME